MNDFELDIEHCLSVLTEGGTILYPTDTIWGIGCDATNPEAVEKVYSLKERPDGKGMIVLIADEKDLLTYVSNPDPHVFNFLKKTTKPTTVIYDGPVGLADNLVQKDGTIAIRIVHDKFCRHLLKRFRKPIVSTSANISGDPTPKMFTEILNYIITGVDYVVSYRQTETTPSESSAIVKLNRDGSTTYIRE
jgi:L-threonylcarbamoyladenylate synthase